MVQHTPITRTRPQPRIDPFPVALETPTPGQEEALEGLYYRLEGIRNRLRFLQRAGAPTTVLNLEHGREQRLQSAIDVRLRGISLRRTLDEKLLLEECLGLLEDPQLAGLQEGSLQDRLVELALAGVSAGGVTAR